MQSNDLARVDTHSIQDGGNGSLQACIPAIAARNFGVTIGDDVETYIDFENSVVLHHFGGE